MSPAYAKVHRFLIVANRTTIHIYSSSTSHLVRSIKLKIDSTTRSNARIITYSLSPTEPTLLWVACSDGVIYRVDWTSGAGADESWTISSTGCNHMTVASMESAGRRRDVVFTTEMRKGGGWRITANELADDETEEIKTVTRTVYTSNMKISFLKTAREGSIVVAASEQRVLIGSLRSTAYDTVDKIKYEFRVFSSSDLISSLDVRAYQRPQLEDVKKNSLKKVPIVDVVVGDVKGSIFVHNDLLGNLVRAQDSKSMVNILPRKLHWHRNAVNTVKWSLDGMFWTPYFCLAMI